MQRLCVFCGSAAGSRTVYGDSARQLGAALAARGLTLVFGGGHIGMMGILADAMLQGGAQVIGVIPRALVEKELAHTGLSELRIVESMHQRKALMADLADGFIALPGGFGTADELFEILTWRQLGIHEKPIGLLNVAGYFDPLLAWLDGCVREGFLRTEHRETVQMSGDAAELLEMICRQKSATSPAEWISNPA